MKKPDWLEILDYANEKLSSGSEPPWAWYSYMQLKDAIGKIIQGENSIRIHDHENDKIEINFPY